MEEPAVSAITAKKKRANRLNLAIMLVAIVLALIVYNWRRPKVKHNIQPGVGNKVI